MGDIHGDASTGDHIAVIFTSRHSGIDVDGYDEAAAHMEALAADQPGYLGIESARGDDGFGISVSYWTDESSATAWKRNAEHTATQQRGRETWYDWYHVRIATVHREYRHPPNDTRS